MNDSELNRVEKIIDKYYNKLTAMDIPCNKKNRLTVCETKFDTPLVNVYAVDAVDYIRLGDLYFRMPIDLLFNKDLNNMEVHTALKLQAYSMPIEIAEIDSTLDVWCNMYADLWHTIDDLDNKFKADVKRLNDAAKILPERDEWESYVDSHILRLRAELKTALLIREM